MRTTMNNFGQKQGHRMTPEQPHLLLGDVINTPIPVHEESKETIIAYLQYAGVKSQEDLSLLDKTDLPRSTVGKPHSYLGDDLVFDEKSGMCRMECASYLKEALTRIENIANER